MKKVIVTPRQKLFVEAYLANGFNATKAAIESGYSEKTAYSVGPRLAEYPHVKEMIAEAQAKMAAKLVITRESVIADLMRIQKQTELTNPSASIKALESIIKVCGFAAPVQSEVTVKTEQPLFNDDNLLLD